MRATPVCRWLAISLLLNLAAAPVLANELIRASAWARPSLGSSNTSVLYLWLRNNGSQPDALVGISTPAAARCELHVSKDDNGIVKMLPLAELELPPLANVAMEPKGVHVMLLGLTRALKIDDHIAVTLQFKTAAPRTIDAIVQMATPAQIYGDF